MRCTAAGMSSSVTMPDTISIFSRQACLPAVSARAQACMGDCKHAHMKQCKHVGKGEACSPAFFGLSLSVVP
eukprot:3184805-Pleurochrysis_carterae.AAC.1